MGSRSAHDSGQFWWGRGFPLYSIGTQSSVQEWLNQSRCCLGYGLVSKEACIRWGPNPTCEAAITVGKDMPGIPDDTVPWSVQKWLNRSICRLGCGLGWAKGSTSSVVFARWHQCAILGGHITATWWIWLNRSSAVAMWPYVKLLWPLVIVHGLSGVVTHGRLLPSVTSVCSWHVVECWSLPSLSSVCSCHVVVLIIAVCL